MQETLLVLPNPYTFIDADGEAQGACPADPTHARGAHMHIGAKLTAEWLPDYEDRIKPLRNGAIVDSRPRPQKTKYVFSTEPQRIPQTPQYLDAIRNGELIAVDEATHRKAFNASVKFRDAHDVLAEKRGEGLAEAIAQSLQPRFSEDEHDFSCAARKVTKAPPDKAADPKLSKEGAR